MYKQTNVFKILPALLVIVCICLVVLARLASRPSVPPTPAGFFNISTLVTTNPLYRTSLNAEGTIIASFSSPRRERGLAQLVVIDVVDRAILYEGGLYSWVALAVSPDGSYVAACGWGNSGEGVYLIDWLEKSETFLIQACSPAWSRDGNSLAMSKWEQGSLQIFIFDLESHQQEVVYEIDVVNGFIAELTWSPDMKKIAFVMDTEIVNGFYDYDLYVLHLEENVVMQLTNSKTAISPVFSPDSNRILYINSYLGPDYLEGVDLEGNCYRYNLPSNYLHSIDLSDNGKMIAVETNRSVLVADPEIVLGKNFWNEGELCQD